MTDFLAPPNADGWTVDDLDRFPDTGVRYELVEGDLLVAPPPFVPHARCTNELHFLLATQAPADYKVGQGTGVTIHGRSTYLIPDILVIRASAYDKTDYFNQDDMVLVVEVLSPSNRGRDLVLKRHHYATGGIRWYWIADPGARTLAVLELDGDAYRESTVVPAGTKWTTEQPFPLTLDPADFL